MNVIPISQRWLVKKRVQVNGRAAIFNTKSFYMRIIITEYWTPYLYGYQWSILCIASQD